MELVETAIDKLSDLLKGRKVAIVGVGNKMRGDDGVGSLVAEQLQSLANENLLVIDAETVPENYLGTLIDMRPEIVLFVDAVDFGGEPGEWNLLPISLLGDKLPSTHTVSLKLLGQILESEGIEIWILAVQPKQIGFGVPISKEVSKAIQNIVKVFSQSAEKVFAPADCQGEVNGDE
ncbi:MAG: hydrogenase 3 maturation endopeptidase HyCI [Armatimonadetes bacterium]|nr:hydrogenase 3 maturation endopeptidase HyCI [Armatimonadota bacterium]MDW8029168.1 hydrogenase 3 maturation endopeptidase HyCI [Armatimonadota bacterium]